MTKKDIAQRIAQDTGLTQLQVLDVIQRTFDAIIGALVTEGRIELRNFGVFAVRRDAAAVPGTPEPARSSMCPPGTWCRSRRAGR